MNTIELVVLFKSWIDTLAATPLQEVSYIGVIVAALFTLRNQIITHNRQ
jgi:hypothetical protein